MDSLLTPTPIKLEKFKITDELKCVVLRDNKPSYLKLLRVWSSQMASENTFAICVKM